MFSDTRRKSCITEFEEELCKSASNPFQELFSKFCSSSTIHGTYFCIASSTIVARILWGIIVCLGIVSAAWIINSSFAAWQEHPVITSGGFPIEIETQISKLITHIQTGKV